MKKSVLLGCLLSFAAYTPALAADISAEVNFRTVSVRVTNTQKAEIPTIQLLDGQKTRVLYADEGSISGDEYIFEDFSFPKEEASGSYIIRIGENGVITEKTVFYVSYAERIEMLKKLEAASSDIVSVIEEQPLTAGITAEDFALLDGNWKKRLENEIKTIDISYEDDDKAEQSCNAVTSAVKKIVRYVKLTSSKDAGKIAEAAEETAGLDMKYWSAIENKAVLAEAFAAQGIDALTINDEGIKTAFDGAVLVSVINESDWGLGKEALKYYSDKGLIGISQEYLNKGAEMYKELKNRKIKDYRKIPGVLSEICSTVGNPGSIGGGGGGGSTGGGGVKNSGTFITTGNSFTEEKNNLTAKQSFSDLNSVEWAREAVEALAEKGIVSGRGGGVFAPQDNLTRAEFVKIIVSAFDLVDENAEAEFEDVAKDSWSYIYVASAKKAGIVSGISADIFGADESITREDMAVITARAAKIFNIEMPEGENAFSDGKDISDYAAGAVKQLSAAGIINGMGDGTFSPKSYVTRAQGAKVIYMMMNRKGK